MSTALESKLIEYEPHVAIIFVDGFGENGKSECE